MRQTEASGGNDNTPRLRTEGSTFYTVQPDSSGREGYSLVKFDKRDGSEAGRVWMDERDPDYLVDALGRFVFVKDDDKEIFALRFSR